MDLIDQRIDRLRRRNTELTEETVGLIRANRLQLESTGGCGTPSRPVFPARPKREVVD